MIFIAKKQKKLLSCVKWMSHPLLVFENFVKITSKETQLKCSPRIMFTWNSYSLIYFRRDIWTQKILNPDMNIINNWMLSFLYWSCLNFSWSMKNYLQNSNSRYNVRKEVWTISVRKIRLRTWKERMNWTRNGTRKEWTW